ncbi:MAG: peptidoglycan recognition family protein [Desulfobacteraceae bacterium]|jgi:hypothetical protein
MDQFQTKALPSKKFMNILGEYAGLIEAPVLKLKLINRVIEKYGNESKFFYKFIPQFDEVIVRRLIHKEIVKICPGKKISYNTFLKSGRLKAYQRLLWHLYPFRLPVFTALFFLIFCLSFWGVNTVAQSYILASLSNKNSINNSGRNITTTAQEITNILEPIWLVEQSKDLEIYSNRLRIITTNTIKNVPRRYLPFPMDINTLPGDEKISDTIIGILYHSSESDILPLSEALNNSIKESSLRLLKYIKRIKSYNYLIDRYGRVYRIVQEDNAAFHAGNSIWADGENIYLNLNHAFIGICFEGKDFEPQKAGITAKAHSSINDSQIKSARELTDWLRFKYKINEKNCVTHGLTSINPDKKLIGYHLDLAKDFPFSKMGLSDKYQTPVPSISIFGFSYDDFYVGVFNNKLCNGIKLSVKNLQKKASRNGLTEAEYRRILNSRFTIASTWQTMIEKENIPVTYSSGVEEMDIPSDINVETKKRLIDEISQLRKYK